MSVESRFSLSSNSFVGKVGIPWEILRDKKEHGARLIPEIVPKLGDKSYQICRTTLYQLQCSRETRHGFSSSLEVLLELLSRYRLGSLETMCSIHASTLVLRNIDVAISNESDLGEETAMCSKKEDAA